MTTRIVLSQVKTAREAYKLIQKAAKLKRLSPWWQVKGQLRSGLRYRAINTEILRPHAELTMAQAAVIYLTDPKTKRAKLVFAFQRTTGKNLSWQRWEMWKENFSWRKARRSFEHWQKGAVDITVSVVSKAYHKFVKDL